MSEKEDKKYQKLFNKYQIVKSKACFKEGEEEVDAYYIKKNERFIFKYDYFFDIFFMLLFFSSIFIGIISLLSLFFASVTYVSVFITLVVISISAMIYLSVYDDSFKVRFKRQSEAEDYISEKIKKKNHVDSKASEGVLIKEFLIAKN